MTHLEAGSARGWRSPGAPGSHESLPRFSSLATGGTLASLVQQWLGQQEAVGMRAQNLKRVFPLLFTHRAPAGGFYTFSLAYDIVAKHGRALRKSVNSQRCTTVTTYSTATKCQTS